MDILLWKPKPETPSWNVNLTSSHYTNKYTLSKILFASATQVPVYVVTIETLMYPNKHFNINPADRLTFRAAVIESELRIQQCCGTGQNNII